jgi:hypothetical protein
VGALTLTQFRVAVRLCLENRTDLDPATVNGALFLNRWTNDAYRHVCLPRVYRHPAMQQSATVTADDAVSEYALASNVYAIRYVINETKDIKYVPERPEEMREGASGRDLTWAREGGNLILRASAGTDGDTIRYYYWAKPTALAADGDVTAIDEYWDQVIVTLAAGYGAASLGMMERADYYDERAARLINDHVPPGTFEAEDRGWRNDITPVVSYSRDR